MQRTGKTPGVFCHSAYCLLRTQKAPHTAQFTADVCGSLAILATAAKSGTRLLLFLMGQDLSVLWLLGACRCVFFLQSISVSVCGQFKRSHSSCKPDVACSKMLLVFPFSCDRAN